jgi:hypothetical protein
VCQRCLPAEKISQISRYLIRAPFSVDKIQYSCREGSVIYKTKMVKGPNRNFQIYDPLDFLAAVTARIPDRREHLVRYYGWHSSVQRGKRRTQCLEAKPLEAPPIEEDTAAARAARHSWARLIKKIYEVDPLICPECSGPLRIMSFIEEGEVNRKILEHLRLRDTVGDLDLPRFRSHSYLLDTQLKQLLYPFGFPLK